MYVSMLKSEEMSRDWTKRFMRSGRSPACIRLFAVSFNWSVKEVRPGSTLGSSSKAENYKCSKGLEAESTTSRFEQSMVNVCYQI